MVRLQKFAYYAVLTWNFSNNFSTFFFVFAKCLLRSRKFNSKSSCKHLYANTHITHANIHIAAKSYTEECVFLCLQRFHFANICNFTSHWLLAVQNKAQGACVEVQGGNNADREKGVCLPRLLSFFLFSYAVGFSSSYLANTKYVRVISCHSCFLCA